MKSANRNAALCGALVDELARGGLRHACIAPGSRSAPLALAFWNDERVACHTHPDERSLGFVALGIGVASGSPAALVTTSGTATANLFPAVVEAGQSNVPMIVITADRPPELRDVGANQAIDQLKLYGDFVRWFCDLGSQEADDTGLLHFRGVAARAAARATQAPPGPIHLNVPLRDPLTPVARPDDVTATQEIAIAGRPGGAPLTRVRKAAARLDRETRVDLRHAVDGAARIAIVAGRQTSRAVAAATMRLSRTREWPLLAEPTSQARRAGPDAGVQIAAYDSILRQPPPQLRPDLTIRVGDAPTSKALREWLHSSRATQVVLDPEAAHREPTRTADMLIQANAAHVLAWLADLPPVSAAAAEEWTERWRRAAGAAERAISDFCAGLGDSFFEPRAYREIAPRLADRSAIYVGSSMPIRDVESYLPALERDLTFLANRGASGIDGIISSAVGAHVGGARPLTAVVGDVSLFHDLGGLLAAKRMGADLTVLAVSNQGGGIFSMLPIAEHRTGWEELFATPTGLDLAKVADLFDMDYLRPATYGELVDAIGRPGLIDLPIDREWSAARHRELAAAATSAAAQAAAAEA